MPRRARKQVQPQPTDGQLAAEAEAAHHEQVAEHLPTNPADQIVQNVANSTRLPDDLVVPDSQTDQRDPTTEFDTTAMDAKQPGDPADEHPPQHRPARTHFGVYTDNKQGIRIDKELDSQPGQNSTRVLISFRDDARPSPDERQLLKDEGFRWDGRAWGKPLNAQSVELAKRTVNQILKGRGDTNQLFL